MNILILDNYDSFTYNLVYIIKKYCTEFTVFRNDKIKPESCLNYDAIVLSPGPGLPHEAGNMPEIIKHCAGKIPILGICLGHQAIGEYLGAELYNLPKVYHGVQSLIDFNNTNSNLFNGLDESFKVGRYHSWAINPLSINENISVTATEKEDCIMAIENIDKKLYGVQFHPESLLTPKGENIIKNFLKISSQAKIN